jgi:PKD repeat protein
MKKSILAIIAVLLMVGSLIAITSTVSACHNLSVTCSPTEKDITDFVTWKESYTIDVKLTPGCGNIYWVGFTVSTPPSNFYSRLYKEGDSSKTPVDWPTAPTNGVVANWNGWISAGTGNEVHYIAILDVWCDQYTPNGRSATITVDVFSTDDAENELEHRVVTTITTVNIPIGIFMEHSVPFRATQWVEPDNWATFDIKITDIGEASGQIDLSKDPMSSDCLDEDWEYVLPATANIAMPTGTTTFQLKVKPPADAGDDDYSIFIVKGINHNNNTFKHTVSAKTIVSLPKPDLSVRADTGIDNICVLTDDPCHNDVFNLSLNVYNLGDIPVSNFDVNFKLSTVGQEALIGSIVVTDTLEPDAYINVQYPWTAIEGTHSLCIHVDENDKIREKDEQGNNEAGLICDVGPARPKSIILSMDVDPTSCMPEDEFTVSGKAKYNPEYGSVPVKDTNVNIKIKETGKTFSTKTKTNGEFTKVCTAPKDADTYTIQVSISDGELSAAANKYLTVALFQVTVLVTPGTILTGDAATLTGRVTDSDYGVADADVTIKLFDINDNEDVNVDTKTDMDGFYSKQVTPTTVTEYSEFKVEVTASKGDIGGTQESKLFVDIDTDSDLIGNLIDTDDDGDNYPDNVEEPYGYDPLDVNDVPYPVADAGADQTVDEGAEVSFDGGQSYSPVGLPLTFEWDFGVDSEEATSDSTTPKYTYNADQEYTVTLKVTDEYKGSDTETITITVTDLGPNAKITGQTSGEEDINLQFSGEQSTSSPDKMHIL